MTVADVVSETPTSEMDLNCPTSSSISSANGGTTSPSSSLAFTIPPLNPHPNRLHGRAFYKSIGSPKYILAPMVEHSHLAWRILVSRHLPKQPTTADSTSQPTLPIDPSATSLNPPILSYTPMLHSRLYHSTPSYPLQNFPASSGTLDGNPHHDRPLFAQFCANDPEAFLSSAKLIAPYVDAIDLNLGCPQGIARKGHYGSFLQDEWELIHSLISTLHNSLDLQVPITAKIRIFEDRNKTLDYARMVLSAGASILAVHGRTREQKGHNTGLADWDMIRFLRDNLPAETVLVANGNLHWPGDADKCLSYTGADAVMSAEGCLYNPTGIFLSPETHTPDQIFPRMDLIAREYLTILRTKILPYTESEEKGIKVSLKTAVTEPNLTNIKSHLFKLLHCLLPRYPSIRQQLATSRPVHPRNDAGIDPLRDFENVVSLVEGVVQTELQQNPEEQLTTWEAAEVDERGLVRRNGFWVNPGGWIGPERNEDNGGWKVPWYRCQPNFRPLPEEAVKKGAMAASFLEGGKKGKGKNAAVVPTAATDDGAGLGKDVAASVPVTTSAESVTVPVNKILAETPEESDGHVSKKPKLDGDI